MIYIEKKSIAPLDPVTGCITDTWNVTNKAVNAPSIRLVEEKMTEIINTKILENLELQFNPIGSGMDYFGTEAPNNYMFADGRELSRTEYAELFAVIGTTYGAGDGSTTFNLPDKRMRVSVMYKEGHEYYGTLGGQIGATSNSYTPGGTIGGTAITKEQLPSYTLYSASHDHTFTGTAASHTHTFTGTAASHNHGITDPGHYHSYPISPSGSGSYVGIANSSPVSASSMNTATSKVTTGITISNKSLTPAGTNSSTSITPKGTVGGKTITVTSGGSGSTHTHTWTGTAQSISTVQPSLLCNYIIKVKNELVSVSDLLERSY